MSVISEFLTKLKRQYPSSKAVSEQIEELRDALHIKTEEYQSQGMSYNEAAMAAIHSLGDVSPLLDEVSGNVKNVYVNKLNKNNAIFSTLIILAEFMLAWLLYSLITNQSIPVVYFSFSLLAIIIGLCAWLIAVYMVFRKEPAKIGVIKIPFRKLALLSVLSWLAISILLTAVNSITGPPYWFPLPVIGISAWPVSIILCHRQLIGCQYDAA